MVLKLLDLRTIWEFFKAAEQKLEMLFQKNPPVQKHINFYIPFMRIHRSFEVSS